MKTLILTGWFWEDYACAAAIALRKFKEADILGISTRRLPEYLMELKGYNEVMILGVGLIGNPELLGSALENLKKNEVKVRWISSMEIPENIGEGIRSNLDTFIKTEGSLTEAVSSCLKIPCKDILPLVKPKAKLPGALNIFLKVLHRTKQITCQCLLKY